MILRHQVKYNVLQFLCIFKMYISYKRWKITESLMLKINLGKIDDKKNSLNYQQKKKFYLSCNKKLCIE